MNVLSFDGQTWTKSDIPADKVKARVRDDKLTWIRAGGASADELEKLCTDFSIHPLAIEDVQNMRQRPKVEDYPDMTFTVARVPKWGEELTWSPVGLFLGTDFIISAAPTPMAELDPVEHRLLTRGLPPEMRDSSALLHMCLDSVVDAWFPFMDELESYIEDLEAKASEHADRETLSDIRDAKQVISKTRKVSGPMREAMLSLERADHPNVREGIKIYLRDVSDHMVRIAERLEHTKEMALFAQEGWNSSLANSQNQAMKRLTVVFALFLIPTFLAGLGGMNFPGFPEWNYWAFTGAILAFVGLGFIVAAWRKWL